MTTQRLRAYAGLASSLGGLVIIFFVWLQLLQVFVALMRFRRFHLLPNIMVGDPLCPNPACDFSVFWPAGRLARIGDFNGLYTPATFQLWRQQLLTPAVQRMDWLYPPPSLLPVAAISYLPFHTAYFVWIALLASAGACILRWAGLSFAVIAAGLLSPAALWAMEMGQFEITTGALLVAGLMAVGRRPRSAGSWLGLLVLKPQAGLLGPFVLLASRNFKGVSSFLCTIAAMLLLTTSLFGVAAWRAYFAHGLAASHASLTQAHPVGIAGGTSIFWMVRSLGANLFIGYVAQAFTSLLAVVLTWAIWRRPEIRQLDRVALTVFFSLLASPYGYIDDMVAYSIALAALAQARAWRIGLLDALLWLWPALCPVVFNRTGILFTPVIIAIAVIRTWHRRDMKLPRIGSRFRDAPAVAPSGPLG